MHKTYPWITFFLLSIFLTTSIQAQILDTGPSNYDELVENSAYDQSVNVAHWSAYIPITAIIVVAILFGIADKNGDKASRHSDDCLGSMGTKASRSSSYTRSYYQHS